MLSFQETPFWSMGLIQLYTWMTWIAHSMTGDLSSSGSFDPSCIVFDSSYVSDTWDWFGSILFVMDQELWYDPTLGIAISESFFSIEWPLCRDILFSVDDGFLSHVHSSGDIRCPFSHWSMRHDWRISSCVLYTEVYPFSVDDGFRYGCSLEVFRFISHWNTRYDWVMITTQNMLFCSL